MNWFLIMPFDWDQCIQEGDVMFKKMISQYHNLVQENRIKHFTIRYRALSFPEYDYGIQNRIHCMVHKWMVNEYNEGKLLVPSKWSVFRDPELYTSIYIGYSTLLQYEEYTYQLIFDLVCEQDDCEDCIQEPSSPHFEVVIYQKIL